MHSSIIFTSNPRYEKTVKTYEGEKMVMFIIRTLYHSFYIIPINVLELLILAYNFYNIEETANILI